MVVLLPSATEQSSFLSGQNRQRVMVRTHKGLIKTECFLYTAGENNVKIVGENFSFLRWGSCGHRLSVCVLCVSRAWVLWSSTLCFTGVGLVSIDSVFVCFVFQGWVL